MCEIDEGIALDVEDDTGHEQDCGLGKVEPGVAGVDYVLHSLLSLRVHSDILVSVTRILKTSTTRKSAAPKTTPDHWVLQDAKARFSELVRKVRSQGPQHVTVHGRDEVVVISAEEFRRLKGEESGQVLIRAMQDSPHRDVEIVPERLVMPVRSVAL
jgi:prevent-host-death family protein